MLTAEENELLTKVGPGTPMGDLMRRYWQPIAASVQLKEEPVRPIRLLGEDLTLYRDLSGKLGLIAQRCAHRRVDLHFGIPCDTGLRCPYHGWRYDETGQCIEQPYDEEEGNSAFKDTVKITAYPVIEKKGLIFAYLGPQPAPLFPNWDLFTWDDVYYDIGSCVIPCNYLQIMENSLDPVHVEWLHTHFSNYVLKRMGHEDLQRRGWSANGRPARHTKIGFDLFDYGIVKKRVMENTDENHPYWTVGHPIVFPNILKTTGFQMRIPIDDNNTYHWWFFPHRIPDGVELPPQEDIPYYDVPLPEVGPKGEKPWSLLDNNGGQDIMMWITQGYVADRTQERLSASDRGVSLYRKLLQTNLQKVQRGEDPMNVFRDVEDNEYLELPSEYWQLSAESARRGDLSRAGGASKYSPVIADALRKAGKEQELVGPVH
jgi:5,5'-dehydrodivanillate O-demethylase